MTARDFIIFWIVLVSLIVVSLISTKDIKWFFVKGYQRVIRALRGQPYTDIIAGPNDHAKMHLSKEEADSSHYSPSKERTIFPRSRRNA